MTVNTQETICSYTDTFMIPRREMCCFTAWDVWFYVVGRVVPRRGIANLPLTRQYHALQRASGYRRAPTRTAYSD